MSKIKTVYVCSNCGVSSPKWQGQCDACAEWNTMVEQLVQPESKSGRKGGAFSGGCESINADLSSYIVSFDNKLSETTRRRFSTSLEEFDRVLGADTSGTGMVAGSVVLIGGEPGIGKSTLLTQMVIGMGQRLESDSVLGKLSKKSDRMDSVVIGAAQNKIAYICGEESPSQISLRLKRMLKNNVTPEELNLVFITTTDVDELVQIISSQKPAVVIVDSIQTLTTRDLAGLAGSLGQIKECAERVTNCVKSLSIPTFLVGHVNKEGSIAGPKVLEHMVDAILELSGERGGDLRFLRAIKNRFGATDEVGVFQLVEGGIAEISNPSSLFLEQTEVGVSGSAVICAMEGTRPILTEVQALVVESQLAMPRRVGRGVDLSRIQVLAAVLQKQLHLPIGMNDLFLSVAGGLQVREPAVELGLAAAIVSSFIGKALPAKAVFVGEVGLMGEIRSVSNLDRRIKEAKRLGYEQVYSRQTHKRLSALFSDLKLTR